MKVKYTKKMVAMVYAELATRLEWWLEDETNHEKKHDIAVTMNEGTLACLLQTAENWPEVSNLAQDEFIRVYSRLVDEEVL